MKKYFLGLWCCFLAVWAQALLLKEDFSISGLFDQYKTSIYQIRVISEATGQKTSIGSGFVVGDGTLLATNYHVISDIVQKERHRLEYVDGNDDTGALTLMDVDVVHDLALVRAEKPLGKPLQLAGLPAQGASLYALGNPHDLGFVIIDGINNGLLKKSAQARILFSGALDSGMSGGPTLNEKGEVIGINVAYLTGGNNISFVIPSEYLKALLEKSSDKKADITASIAEQLFADNHHYFDEALKQSWPTTKIGHFVVPMAMSQDVRCWDSSPEPDVDDLLAMESVTCFNDRSTFINQYTSVGEFGYSYAFFYGREPLLESRFYRLYSGNYQLHFDRRPQRDYGDIECQADFVAIADKPFKATFCRRPSQHFKNGQEVVEDVRFVAAQIGEKQEGFRISIAMNGVQPSLAKAVVMHLLEQISWQN